MKVAAILPAAGLGTRMKPAEPGSVTLPRKQFLLLDGVPVVLHTIRKFVSCRVVDQVILALRPEDRPKVDELIAAEGYDKPVTTVDGGDSRQASVENGLAAVAPGTDVVAVHDAVRPFIDPDTIEEVIRTAADTGAAIVGIIPVDTVKQVHLHKITGTLNRDRLVLAQTPQVFRTEILQRAYAQAKLDGFTGTDESSLVERIEVEVTVVAGSDRNIKITRPSDLELAQLFLREEKERQS